MIFVFVFWVVVFFPISFVVAVVLLLSLGTQAATRRVQRIYLHLGGGGGGMLLCKELNYYG